LAREKPGIDPGVAHRLALFVQGDPLEMFDAFDGGPLVGIEELEEGRVGVGQEPGGLDDEDRDGAVLQQNAGLSHGFGEVFHILQHLVFGRRPIRIVSRRSSIGMKYHISPNCANPISSRQAFDTDCKNRRFRDMLPDARTIHAPPSGQTGSTMKRSALTGSLTIVLLFAGLSACDPKPVRHPKTTPVAGEPSHGKPDGMKAPDGKVRPKAEKTAFTTVADYDKYLVENPEDPQAYYNRGTLHLRAGNTSSALADFTKAIELKPDYQIAWVNRAVLHVKAARFDAALIDYTRAIELDPTNGRMYFQRAFVYEKKNDPKRALADYDKAIELKPDYAEAYVNRGLLQETGGSEEKALADYNKAIELNGKLPKAYSNRARILFKAKKLDEALADFSKAVELDPQYAHGFYNRGLVYLTSGDIDGAISDFSKAVELEPGLTKAFINRGAAYTAKKDFDAAGKDYSKAIELEPENGRSYISRAVNFFNQQKYDEAWADVAKAKSLKVNPSQKFLEALKKASRRDK
jgi:tetratricopeptide (TPR) repeat protein